jgi:hypothetical protein
MSEETARAIVITITAIGGVAWLAGLTVMLRATRERQARDDTAADPFHFESEPHAATITGGAEVDGEPESLAAKLAERLALNGLGPFGPVKIVGSSRQAVAFEAAGQDLGAGGYGGSGFRRGHVRFGRAGNRTRVEYVVETSSRGVLLALGWLALGLGLVALVTAPWLEFTYVLPDPNIRGQALQTFQMVHFLWPPFLFAHLSRQPERILRAHMEALINNLPYL